MNNKDDDMQEEYDLKSLGQGVRGKYSEQYKRETNIVTIDPELTDSFPNTKAVNDALREVLDLRKQSSN